MSRISNERIKALTLKECNYSQALVKESQRVNKHTAENFITTYKTSIK